MKPKYLFMLLGHPGSGKSYFSRQLATEMGAARINGDAMRTAMFGSFAATKAFEATYGPSQPLIFGALDYAALQILAAGMSVIYDVQFNQKFLRQRHSKIAREHDAIPVIIWVKTPIDIALQRGQDRELTADQQNHNREKMEALINKHIKALEAPTDGEPVVVIDGTLDFKGQLASFWEQVANLN